MSDDFPVPEKFRILMKRMMSELWPNVNFPKTSMVIDDEHRRWGSMAMTFTGGKCDEGTMKLTKSRMNTDFIEVVLTLAHELSHFAVAVKHGHRKFAADHSQKDREDREAGNQNAGGHGPLFRAEMLSIGVHYDPVTRVETMIRGKELDVLFQDFMAKIMAPELFNSEDERPRKKARRPSQGREDEQRPLDLCAQAHRSDGERHFASQGVKAFGKESGGKKRKFLIAADCSMSMMNIMHGGETVFEIQRRAVKTRVSEIRKRGGEALIIGYSGVGGMAIVDHPDQLVCDDGASETSGTSFIGFLRYAQQWGADHIDVFSDGEPACDNMFNLERARNLTKCDIATYFLGDPTNSAAIKIMKWLARGDGQQMTSQDVNELESAMAGNVNIKGRSAEDLSEHVNSMLEHAAQQAQLNGRVIEHGQAINDLKHGFGTLTRGLKMLFAGQKASTGLLKNANQALDVIDAQGKADELVRQEENVRLDATLKGAVGQISDFTASHYGQMLVSHASDVANGAPALALPVVEASAIPAALIQQAAALMSSPRASSSPQLPRPQREEARLLVCAPEPRREEEDVQFEQFAPRPAAPSLPRPTNGGERPQTKAAKLTAWGALPALPAPKNRNQLERLRE